MHTYKYVFLTLHRSSVHRCHMISWANSRKLSSQGPHGPSCYRKNPEHFRVTSPDGQLWACWRQGEKLGEQRQVSWALENLKWILGLLWDEGAPTWKLVEGFCSPIHFVMQLTTQKYLTASKPKRKRATFFSEMVFTFSNDSWLRSILIPGARARTGSQTMQVKQSETFIYLARSLKVEIIPKRYPPAPRFSLGTDRCLVWPGSSFLEAMKKRC